jgi:hypothetical protein
LFGERVCFRAFTSGAKELLLLPQEQQVTLIKQLSGVNVSLCVSMYASLCVSMYVSLCVSMYVSLCVSMYVSLCMRLYVSLCMRLYASLCVCLHVSLCMCLYVSLCMCLYVSLCICLYVSLCMCLYVSLCKCLYVSLCVSLCVSTPLRLSEHKQVTGNNKKERKRGQEIAPRHTHIQISSDTPPLQTHTRTLFSLSFMPQTSGSGV